MRKFKKAVATGLAVLTVAGSMLSMGISASAISPDELATTLSERLGQNVSKLKYHFTNDNNSLYSMVIDDYGVLFSKNETKYATINNVKYGYVVYENKAYITDVDSNDKNKNIYVPKTLNNLKVFRISAYAFSNTKAKGIYIQDSHKVTLEPLCFYGCNVKTISLGENTTFSNAFLTKEGVKKDNKDFYVDPQTFDTMQSSEEFTANYDLNTKNIRKISAMKGYAMFCASTVETVKWTKAESTIPAHAFSYCENLKQVTNIDNVKVVGESAFADSSLPSITLPNCANVRIGAFANSRLKTFNAGKQENLRFEYQSMAACSCNTLTPKWRDALCINVQNVGKVVFERGSLGNDGILGPDLPGISGRGVSIYANREKMNVQLNSSVSENAKGYYELSNRIRKENDCTTNNTSRAGVVVYTNDASAQNFGMVLYDNRKFPYIVTSYLTNKSKINKTNYIVGDTLNFTKSATGGANAVLQNKNKKGSTYKYIVEYRRFGSNDAWKELKNNKFTTAGEYDIRVIATDSIPYGYDHKGDPYYDISYSTSVITKANIKVYDKIDGKLTNTSKLNKTSITKGDRVTVSGNAKNNYGAVKYSFEYQPPKSSKWYTMGTPYNGKTTMSFKPGKLGTYKIRVTAKDEIGYTSAKTINLTVN